MEATKKTARAGVESAGDDLVELSHRIHEHPEVGFEEVLASRWVAEALEAGGFEVTRGAAGLETALVARAGSGPLHLAICAEYDCLPGIGHACGHNIIASSAVGAGLALAPLADELGLTVTVVGTPAEEGGGGKILMLRRGAFDGFHAAMMVHPSPVDVVEQPFLAVAHVEVRYRGKEAHASSFPELGINAADAATVAQTCVGLLRQHIRQSDRIHGIVTHGGEAPNVVPAHTTMRWYVRARTIPELDELFPKVRRCFEAGALATGCTMEVVEISPTYADMRVDAALAAHYRRNALDLGRPIADLPQALLERTAGSTDMGNVSQAMPSIHPMIGIDSLPAVNHQPEFAAHCVGAAADKAIVDGAVAMAWTAIDVAADDALRTRLQEARR